MGSRKSRWRIRIVGMVLASLTATTVTAQDPPEPDPSADAHAEAAKQKEWGPEETARYSTGGQARELLIDLDEVGIVVRPQATREQIVELARGNGLELADRLGSWMYTLKLATREPEDPAAEPEAPEAEPRWEYHPDFDYDHDDDGDIDRRDLLGIALQMEREHPDVISQAGLMVRFKGMQGRMIMTEKLSIRLKERVAAARFQVQLEAHQHPEFDKQEYALHARQAARSRWFSVEHLEGEAALDHVDLLSGIEGVAEVKPSFIHPVEDRSAAPEDLLSHQWHHENRGPVCPPDSDCVGTNDADLDTVEAWELSTGASDVVIAVMENHGFQTDHPDLVNNLWENPAVPGEHGRNFKHEPPSADLLDDDGRHGTAVAGCAVAPHDGEGVTGTCPDCSLMLIVNGQHEGDTVEAIDYAWQSGADVLVCSWGYPPGFAMPDDVRDAVRRAATQGRDGKGTVVVWASSNNKDYACSTDLLDMSGLPFVLGVTGASDEDRRLDKTGYGPCLDVMAPTRHDQGSDIQGSWNVVSTDLQGADGYNSSHPVDFDDPLNPCAVCDEVTGEDYTVCFGGNSAGAPMVGGVVGLVLAADAEARGTDDSPLTAEQVRRVIHDTCDKINDSRGFYHVETGYSAPPGMFDTDTGTADKFAPTHAFGRVNAFEAVKLTAPVAKGGRAGIDLVVRDHRLDWGNTAQPSHYGFEKCRGFEPPWRSVDIKVDAPDAAGDFGPVPADSEQFAALADEAPVPNAENRVYVRVRNRGPVTADNVSIKLFATTSGTTLPPLPDDLWPGFPADPADTSVWYPCAVEGSNMSSPTTAFVRHLGYSGPSAVRDAVAPNASGTDGAAVVGFTYDAPTLHPALAGYQHHAFMAVVGSDADALPADAPDNAFTAASTLNNVALHSTRPVSVAGLGGSAGIEALIWMESPGGRRTKLALRDGGPGQTLETWRIDPQVVSAPGFDPAHPGAAATPFDPGTPFLLPPGVQVPVFVRIGTAADRGEVTLLQSVVNTAGDETIVGGTTYRLQP